MKLVLVMEMEIRSSKLFVVTRRRGGGGEEIDESYRKLTVWLAHMYFEAQAVELLVNFTVANAAAAADFFGSSTRIYIITMTTAPVIQLI